MINLIRSLSKAKIIGIIVGVGLLLIAIFQGGFYSSSNIGDRISEDNDNRSTINDNPFVVSTKPDPLDNITVLPDQEVSITFNKPLEGLLALKTRIEPALDIEIRLSDDRKTVFMKPKKAYQIGQSYTFTILSDTGFEGGDKLGHEAIYHIGTIAYKGI